ncbi:MAG: glycosyltransferase [Microthrixaceae bacterium]|nr:glycosyltransferase [Microthrixaceae bacterium]
MRINQVLAGAAAGDAITRIALNTRALLRRYGDSEVFAHHIDPSVGQVIRPLTQLPEGDSNDIVLLRASIGDEEIGRVLASRAERIVVGYHNITPPEFFDSVDPGFAMLLREGRTQLRSLAPRVSAAFADSTFNAQDLISLGYSDVEVVPPLLDPSHLLAQPPAPGFALEIRRRAPAELILFVGQMLPHKRPHLLVAAHHLLTSHHLPDAALVMVGTPRSPSYASALSSFVATLNLPRVWFTGPIDDHELAELYRRADVFVTATSHEGFCVPLLEAMAASVPVVATDAGAIPETAGDAALLLDDAHPAMLAEALAMVLHDRRRGAMALAGRQRAAALSLENAERRFVEFLSRRLPDVVGTGT